jgi:hypothetical protein
MPKMIDADKLLECLSEELTYFEGRTSQYRLGRRETYEWVIARINSGTFDPTPVQPDTGTEILLKQQAHDAAMKAKLDKADQFLNKVWGGKNQ